MGAKRLSWCEYLERLQIEAEECEKDKSNQEPAEVVPVYPEYPLCQGYFHMCMPSEECESGTVCMQTRTRSKCCTAPHSRCPTVEQLGFTCRKKTPTNWCTQDEDCGVGPTIRHICCPTGCNYNICLRDQSPVPSWNKITNLGKR
ncbi:Protein T28C12.6 [Aphelenchoides avenae]|nr:Protein T28C12.6 [Aphelenchus avenae]